MSPFERAFALYLLAVFTLPLLLAAYCHYLSLGQMLSAARRFQNEDYNAVLAAARAWRNQHKPSQAKTFDTIPELAPMDAKTWFDPGYKTKV